MASRPSRNPELTRAAAELKQAAQHVRAALHMKLDEVRQVAASELAKAKASALKKTGIAQSKVEAALNRAEDRLHKLIAKAQKSLDKAVLAAEKRSMASAAATAAPPGKPPARKTAVKDSPARGRASARNRRAPRKTG
jgi:type I site-specific restriction endonuclease